MDRPRIERLSIKNFACIKDATFELAQFNALIGPNDSGQEHGAAGAEAVDALR